MNKILVPTDLSPTAELGLRLAVDIARACNGSISLVNFTRDPYTTTFSAMGEISAKVDQEADLFALQLLKVNKEALQELATKYSEQVPVEFAIVDEKFKTGIDEYLRREQIDLVVMGTSGEENAKEIFTGNHTEQVIQVSGCPVISVRDGFQIKDFSNVVLAIALIDQNLILEALRSLQLLVTAFKAHVHLVHVVHHAEYSTEERVNFFKETVAAGGLTNYSITILESNDATEAVILYARQVRAGLVAVVKNRADGIFRIFSSNFSDRLVKETGRPVFTFNATNV